MLFKFNLRQFIDNRFPKIAKIYRLLRDYWIFLSYKPYKTKYGFIIYGDANYDISREQTGEIEILSKYIDLDTIFIDIGANVGIFSCYASYCLGCQVVAIEPNPLNFKLLCKNIYLNNIKNINVFLLALSDTIEIKPLFGGGQGASLIEGWGNIKSTYINLVPSTTLDNITSMYENRKLFIKIDSEGSEYNILTGAPKTINNITPKSGFFINFCFRYL